MITILRKRNLVTRRQVCHVETREDRNIRNMPGQDPSSVLEQTSFVPLEVPCWTLESIMSIIWDHAADLFIVSVTLLFKQFLRPKTQSLPDLWGILVAPGGVRWISWASEPLSSCTSGCGVVPCRLQVRSPGGSALSATCPKAIQETSRGSRGIYKRNSKIYMKWINI